MKRLFTAVLAMFILLSASEPASAKGRIVKIEIKGATFATPLEIIDSEIVSKFSIWNGPGVSVNGQPAHLDPNNQAGMFIDWPKGMANERPAGLQRYEVTFHLEAQQGTRLDGTAVRQNDAWSRYVVFYGFHPSTAGGYMYLPGEGDEGVSANARSIYHGIEGNWFYSSSAWEKLVRPLIEQATGVTIR